jgi:hypothetical protein
VNKGDAQPCDLTPPSYFRRVRILAAFVLAVIASAPQAFAQSELPHGLIGISITRATSDAASRMRLGSEARPWVLAGEVSVRVTPRVAIGAEAIDLGTATGETAGRSFRSLGEQRERALMGLMRVRVSGSERVAVDLVGGAGVLWQRHSVFFAPCFSGCAVSADGALTDHAPALVAGVDVPIRAGRYFSIAAIGRYFFLRRGDNVPSGPTDQLPWQFEYRSSGRIAIGASARVVW